ncbi:MMPL family transporter [Cytobacillus sp. FSL K6-0265]|uniref:MMPL family transporter n=1 Tax=Cytobacillus sp. FSL K6-0265 TaxID=2921448 RepID=UPI0030FAE26E
MSKLKNVRTLLFFGWVVISVLSFLWMPNMDDLVREKGQITIPDNALSREASQLLEEMDENADTYDFIAVIGSKDGKEMSNQEQKELDKLLSDVKARQSSLGIEEMTTHLDGEEAASVLTAEDGSTILAQISIDREQGELQEVANSLRSEFITDTLEVSITGNELVMEDFVQATQDGIKKTEAIAVVFILLVLILVFRSPIIPFISLLSVGVSYIVSMSIIANLVDSFNYPFSNFTQVFLVVILFGIGTDYNILLFTRFKEELSKQETILEALKVTYRTAGITVLYSGLAVFIGFIVLMFAQFSLYQASSAVAIGVAVLVAVLYTFNPFFMYVLGKKMFWPSKKFDGHADSKFWGFLSGHSIKRPFLSLLIVLLISLPFVFKYSGELSYNDLLEVDDSFESKQGINRIEDHFPSGFSAPATLVIKNEQSLNQQESLQAIDELTEKILAVDGVSKVQSVTRPAGEKIPELYLNDQTDQLNQGIGDANKGVGTIHDGLSSAEGELSANQNSNQLEDVQTLIDGTTNAKNGASTLVEALNELTTGIQSGSSGASELNQGIADVKKSVEQLSGATGTLLNGYTELQKGLSNTGNVFTQMNTAVTSMTLAFTQIEQSLTNYIEENPEDATDEQIQLALGTAREAKLQVDGLSTQLESAYPQYETAMARFAEVNAGLEQVHTGLGELRSGLDALESGANELQTGLANGARASNEMATKTGELTSGLAQINEGQIMLQTGLDDLSEKMVELEKGLAESTDGLNQVGEGLQDANKYLSGLSDSKASEKFFIPEEVLNGEEFQQALDMYVSDNQKMTTLTIVLEENPYTNEAMKVMEEVNRQVPASMNATVLQDAEYAIGGQTQQNLDLQNIATEDFARTATIMLIGIGIVLMVITRSVMQPLYIIAALLLAYYTSLGISEWMSQSILGASELAWNVPFFGFIMIIALGVDYSIFLMMRFNEVDGNPVNAILTAAKNIGGVVISAAIILGGTFAALIPSGVITLIEVALVVLIGLIMLSLLMLPILVPSFLAIGEKLKRRREEG